jgi:hypothetical protein
METVVAEVLRTRAFREFTHVVWGYGTLIERALAANDDPRPLLAVLTRATERVARSTHA